MKTALLAGFGGIGKNVYHPELLKLGYTVDVLDILHPDANYRNVTDIKSPYDLAVICTPNSTHGPIAEHLAQLGTRDIFVEKPGLATANEWNLLEENFPDTRFHVVKNNLYRASYDNLLEFFDKKDVVAVDINWLNGNRIPSPGSWFTNKDMAFGGVSRDLMPHLYCFAVKIFGLEVIRATEFKTEKNQRWSLDTVTGTDYGVVNPSGIYNVDDYARASAIVDFYDIPIDLRITASWKEGYDKQSVTLFFRDGTTYEWQFGLCPAEAYGTMLKNLEVSSIIDRELHLFLEKF